MDSISDKIDRIDELRQEAINRFKEKVKSYKTEQEQMNYIKEDLKKYGYISLIQQRSGFRPTRL